MNEEKILIYAVIAACVLGVVVVGYFALTSAEEEGFTEVYFEEYEELPSTMYAGSRYAIPFSVVSHEKNVTSYSYTVRLDSQVIDQGGFVLQPAEKKYITAVLMPETVKWNITNQRTRKWSDVFDFPLEDSWIGARKIYTSYQNLGNATFVTFENETFTNPLEYELSAVPGKLFTQISLDEEKSYYNEYDYVDIQPESKHYSWDSRNLTVKDGKVYVERVLREEWYSLTKSKVSIAVESDTGETYEIHFWTSVVEP
jgi:hypothetical protein